MEIVESSHVCSSGSIVDVFLQRSSASMSQYVVRSHSSPALTLLDAMLLAFAALLFLHGGIELTDSTSNLCSLGLVLAVAFRICRTVLTRTEETVTALRGVGLQITSSSWGGIVRRSTFVDLESIHTLGIHEGYFRHRCVFFLMLTQELREDVVVLFQSALPRLPVIQSILRGLRHTLYQERLEGQSLAEKELLSKV